MVLAMAWFPLGKVVQAIVDNPFTSAGFDDARKSFQFLLAALVNKKVRTTQHGSGNLLSSSFMSRGILSPHPTEVAEEGELIFEREWRPPGVAGLSANSAPKTRFDTWIKEFGEPAGLTVVDLSYVERKQGNNLVGFT